jgi:drug/metabolite transporter (DMT)-like permease
MFVLALAVHGLVWRLRIPRKQTRALVAILALVPVCVAACIALAGSPPPPLRPPLADLPAAGLFYLGASVCYLITYAGVEEVSPSLLIIRTLESAGERGCSREELAAVVTEERFVAPRIAALRRDGIIAESAEGNRLTPRGARVASLAGLLARCFQINGGG